MKKTLTGRAAALLSSILAATAFAAFQRAQAYRPSKHARSRVPGKPGLPGALERAAWNYRKHYSHILTNLVTDKSLRQMRLSSHAKRRLNEASMHDVRRVPA